MIALKPVDEFRPICTFSATLPTHTTGALVLSFARESRFSLFNLAVFYRGGVLKKLLLVGQSVTYDH